jgi:hypothetical protein
MPNTFPTNFKFNESHMSEKSIEILATIVAEDMDIDELRMNVRDALIINYTDSPEYFVKDANLVFGLN